MSLYAKYVQEKTNKFIIETDQAFATYCFPTPGQCYIEDIYVIPEARKSNVAAQLADSIITIAKERGCTELLGSVVPSNKGSTDSVRVLLAYGMTLKEAHNDFIVFSRSI